MPVPEAARSNVLGCGRSPGEIVGSNPTRGHECQSVVSVVCCEVQVSVSSRSFVQRSPTECGTSLCVIYISVCETFVRPRTGKFIFY